MRNEKQNRKARTSRRDFWRSFPLGLIDFSDMPLKAPWAGVYLVGAIWIWGGRKAALELLENAPLTSPIMEALLRNIFPSYLLLGAIALAVLLLYPMGRKAVEDDLQRVGLVNHAGEAPRLLRKRREIEHPNVTIWEFDNRGIPLKEWEDNQGWIEAALDITIAKIRYGKGKRRVLLYAVPARSDLPERINWRDKYLSKADFVLALGESLLGPVTVDLDKIPHILLGGSTGSGKSLLLKLLLMQALQKGAEVYIADFKGGVDFPRAWREKCRMCFTEADLLQTLDQLVAVQKERSALFSAAGCDKLSTYNEIAARPLPRLIFACDEVAEVLGKTGRSKEDRELRGQIENRLATLARLGRAFGIHLILATQRPDTNVIPGQIRSNMDFRVCGRADSILSGIILDNTSAAEQIPKDARGRFITGDGTVFQGYLLNEDDL